MILTILQTLKQYGFRTLLSALIICSASAQAKQILDSVAAVVDDDVILQSELKDRIQQVTQNIQRSGNTPPPESELRRGVLDQLIIENIQLQMGGRGGVRVSDEQLNAMMADIAQRQGMSLNAFRNQLLNEGNYHFVRDQIRKDTIIQQVQSGSLNRRVNVTPDEIDAFLNSPEGLDLSTIRYQLGHLLVPIDENASASERKKARAIINTARIEIATGKSIEQWVKVYNLRNGTQLSGDNLGWRTQEELPSLFADIAPRMNIGDISDAIEAANGMHMLQLLNSSGKAQLVQQNKTHHILIKLSAILDEDDARKKALSLRERALNGETFADLAQQYSEDIGSAREGGDMGWSRPGMFVPEFEAAADGTQIGSISEPVRTQFGWHIIYIEDRKMTDMREDMITNRAYSVLRERKLTDVREEWLQQIRNNAYVDIK